MACSQELHKGDLVAVSVAMEAPGSEGYMTRGSIVGPELAAIASLYIGKSLQRTQPCVGIRLVQFYWALITTAAPIIARARLGALG